MEWDDRLISRDRAYAVAGEWPVFYHETEYRRRWWRCGSCAQAVTEIHPHRPVTTDGLVSAIVRHAVTAHNVSLSGAGDGRGPDEAGAAARDRGRGDGHAGDGAAVDRSRDQTAGGGRVPGTAGGGGG